MLGEGEQRDLLMAFEPLHCSPDIARFEERADVQAGEVLDVVSEPG